MIINKKHTIISLLITLSTILLFFTACKKNDTDQPSKTLKQSIQKTDSLLSLIPDDSAIVCKIKINDLLNIDSIKKQLESNLDTEFVKNLEAAGLNMHNISNIYFAVSPQESSKYTNGIFLFETNKSLSIDKYVEITKEDSGITINKEEYKKHTIYIIPTENPESNAYFLQFSDKIAAIGSEKTLKKSIDLYEKDSDNSISNNKTALNLYSKIIHDDMFWVLALDPNSLIKENIKQFFPIIDNGVSGIDFKDDTLLLNAKLYCKNNQEAQKLQSTIQVYTMLITSNPSMGIMSDDIKTELKNNELTLNIQLSADILESIAKQQMQAQQQSPVFSPSN